MPEYLFLLGARFLKFRPGRLARIIHERSVFVNNAPPGAALAAREVSTAAFAACSRLALSDATQTGAESKPGGRIIHSCVNNPG